MKHSSARNVIERAFGLLKGHWAILRGKSYYPIQVQCRTIMACCLLHNLINREMTYIEELDDEDDGDSIHATTSGDDITYIEPSKNGLNGVMPLLRRCLRNGSCVISSTVPSCSKRTPEQAISALRCTAVRVWERSIHGGPCRDLCIIGLNVPASYNSVPTKDVIDMEFPAMCSPRMNMSPENMMGGRSGRSSDGRTGSNGQKRKHSMQQFETYDLIHECMEAATDQLRTIAEWPEKFMSWEDAVAAQVIELIEAIPKLTMAEKSKCVMLVNQKVSLMRSFIKMPDSMKAIYGRILLGGNL
ncbi:hypothetical protein IC582_026534 [Cucumis melo]